ncbi:MAG: protein kinase [Bacteroidales bacterium]|nr:protein kinase [Bacteroidales bacterium]
MTDGNSSFDLKQTPLPSGEMEPVRSGATCETWRFQRWGKWFVLKRLKAELRSDPRLVAALEKEFDLGIRLDHPGIVRYFEKGSDAQGPFLIEEYIDGQTLADWVEEHRPLPDAEVRRLMGELCDSVGYLHEAGIVHADLGPGNILVTRQGSHAKLIDLGFSSQYSYVPVAGGTPDFSASYGTLTQENFADVQQRHLASFSRASAAADSIASAWTARFPAWQNDLAVIPAEELQRDLGRYQGDVLRYEREARSGAAN